LLLVKKSCKSKQRLEIIYLLFRQASTQLLRTSEIFLLL
jgi:hypothetical protein